MTAKHTPMPWEYDGERTITSPNRGKTHQQIAEIGTPGIALAKVDRANGKFIESACNSHDELLEACKVGLAELESWSRVALEDPVEAFGCKALRAAIAKATKEPTP